jgi:integrase
MACVSKRREKWVADWRDSTGARRWKTFATKREAEDFLTKAIPESRQWTKPAIDPASTVEAYAEHWLKLIATAVKPRTHDSYQKNLRLHLLTAIGPLKVRQLHKGRIKMLLAEKLASGLSPNSVRIIHATLRGMLNAAVDDGILVANPAERLGRQLRLITRIATRQEEIKAMTREQRQRFLESAAQVEPKYYPLFFTLASTGMRLGEGLALQWQDLHLEAREVRVARALSAGRVDTPKAGHGRTVDLSKPLSEMLGRLQVQRKAEKLKSGWSEIPLWAFCTSAGTPLDESKVRKAMSRVLKAAGLPLHFSPHCLRHTYASLLLQQGESPAYVQRQLGHASIQLTVDTYGKWLPNENKGAVDRLDEASGSRMVAEGGSGGEDVFEAIDKFGGPCRDRTCGPLIKSQLLYQLS